MNVKKELTEVLNYMPTPSIYGGGHEGYTQSVVRAVLVKIGCDLKTATRLAKLNKGCVRKRLTRAVEEFVDMGVAA